MLTASGLSRAHGNRVLFSDANINLLSGHRTALVGGNGVGKTTLIEILVGLEPPDSGRVRSAKDLRIGYLPQDLTESVTGTVIEATMAGATQINELAERLAELEQRLGSTSGQEQTRVIDQFGEAQARFEQLGGYALEAEAHRVLAGLGFSPELTARPVSELSGGWRMRVALARLLLSQPDLLALDEPTNHLDVDSVAWLEDHLSNWGGALLFVSHDRDFIDGVANRVIEVAGGKVTEYVGGFAEFVVLREEALMQAQAAVAQQARKRAHLEQFIERFRYKASKARQVQSRIKVIEKLEKIEVPDRKELKARFGFPEPRRSSRVVVEFENVTAGYDNEIVLRGVNAVVERGKKIAIVGPNGAGKTTLVKMLLGRLEPIEGTITIGNNVDHAEFGQHQTEILDLTRSVINEFRANCGDMIDRNLRTVLGSFGFTGDATERKVADLSGGEQTRLALAMTMANPVNLLVLDEPTNHLDLPSCDLLEDALRAYPGTVILVTHDRHLIRGVADALLEVRDGTARWHEGVDENVLTPGRTKPELAEPRAVQPMKSKRQQKKRNPPSQLGKQLRQIEESWEAAEHEVAEVQSLLAEPATYEDPKLLRTLTARHEVAKTRASDLMTEWERAKRG